MTTSNLGTQVSYLRRPVLLFVDMNRLSDAVARVVRREIADRQISNQEFAVSAGKTKTTAWRQIEGISRMSIDDAEDYATALGWTLDDLIQEARALQDETSAATTRTPTPADEAAGAALDRTPGRGRGAAKDMRTQPVARD